MHVNCVRFIGLHAQNPARNAVTGKMRGKVPQTAVLQNKIRKMV